MFIDPRMIALAGAGAMQEQLKKQSLAILEMTNQVMSSSVIKETGHLELFNQRLTQAFATSANGSKVLDQKLLDQLKQDVKDGVAGREISGCSCKHCADARIEAEKIKLAKQHAQELEAVRRRQEDKRRETLRQWNKQEEEAKARELKEKRAAEKKAALNEPSNSVSGALIGLVFALVPYILVTSSNDGLPIKDAIQFPNAIILVLVAALALRGGYLGGATIFVTMMIFLSLATGLILGIKHLLPSVDAVVKFITPHVVVDFVTFAQSFIWLLFFWFLTFSSSINSSSKAKNGDQVISS